MRRRTIVLTVLTAALVVCGPVGRASARDLDSLSALIDAWMASAHADYHSPSFTHWNKDGEVPTTCAACHSGPGLSDFLGADGSAASVVDRPAPINAPVGCAACHTAAAHALDSVRFPSGVDVGGLGASAVCTVCHQGRQSGDAVATATAGLDEDAVADGLGFLNVHYGIAAAVLHGADVRGGYQYPGRAYAGRFRHVPSANTCVACHDPHTSKVDETGCLSCHQGVADLRAIRTRHADFDGDGNARVGIDAEIDGLRNGLHAAIRAYAATVAGTPIGYAEDSFPYFFVDGNADGTIAPEEAMVPNRYARWTPRLLKAAYNYHVATKDAGGFAHNPHYLLQILHDSLESLSERVPVDMGALHRPQ